MASGCDKRGHSSSVSGCQGSIWTAEVETKNRAETCLTLPRYHQPRKSGRYRPEARKGRRSASGKRPPGAPRQSGNRGPRRSGKSHKSSSQSSGNEKTCENAAPCGLLEVVGRLAWTGDARRGARAQAPLARGLIPGMRISEHLE